MVQQPRATVLDIARKAGVSRATVSLVLRGSGLVKAETAAKVRLAMEEVGYVYNRAAANLRTSRTNFVGMVMSNLRNPFFCELAVGIEERLFKLGYTPLLANTDDDFERQEHVLRSMMENGAAGVILSPALGTEARHLNMLPSSFPLVITMRSIPGTDMPYVGQDNRNGSRKSVEHLIALGHERIAFFGWDNSMTTQHERYLGYCDALNNAGLPIDDSLVFDTHVSKAGGSRAMELALEHKARPTAATCFNDLIAIGAVRALSVRGLRAGRDFAIVGFDDLDEAKDNFPPLTTINAETIQLGARAADMMSDVIEQKPGMVTSAIGSSTLVVRASCGAHAYEGGSHQYGINDGRPRHNAA